MIAVKAGWRRTIQTAPYESETLELSVEDRCEPGSDGLSEVRELSRQLSAIGDELLAERLSSRQKPSEQPVKPGRVDW